MGGVQESGLMGKTSEDARQIEHFTQWVVRAPRQRDGWLLFQCSDSNRRRITKERGEQMDEELDEEGDGWKGVDTEFSFADVT